MDRQPFLSLCKKNYPKEFFPSFKQAVFHTKKLTQERLGGDTLGEHNVRVATILIENNSEPAVVLAGLLQHTTLSRSELNQQFGSDVTQLVLQEDVKEIKSRNKKITADALRKILLTTIKDVRVLFIKLAVKLDNLRTIAPLPKPDQQRIAEEVLEIYAPLAYRLGLEKIRVELEDLALQIISPKKYHQITQFLEQTKEQRDELIALMIKEIKRIAQKKVDLITVKGRSKHIYSIYKKLLKKKHLEQIQDIFGIRVVVKTVKDCYIVLGLLHETFTPLPGRLKDYIAHPKSNLYQSLHTGLQLKNGQKIEVQIRTQEMDESAEEGLAAHWRYKGLRSDQIFEKKVAWLRNFLEMQQEGSHTEFLKAAEVDIFGDKIYCYTPKGDVKELPAEASLLDFAYTVHEEIGNKTVGGRVNGKFVPLKQVLHHGDVIEIITNKQQRPRRSWLKIVKSPRARQKIRKSLKAHETLAPLHYHSWKPAITDEQAILVASPDFPKATCVLAKCCSPLPGEVIVGLVTKRRIISVHHENCKLAQKEQERWVPVHWKETFTQKIQFHVRAEERSGLLAELLHTLAQAGFEVKEAKVKFIDAKHAQCSFLIIPRALDELTSLISRLKKIRSVQTLIFE